MPAYVNIPDIVKIGLIAVVFIFIANRGLKAVGLENLTA